MILIDAGCEVGMYASDITRTFPANGNFTGPQRDLYEVVLSVQKSLIKKCTIEEAISLHELQRHSEFYLIHQAQLPFPIVILSPLPCDLPSAYRLSIACSSFTEELKQLGFKTSPEMLKNRLVSGTTRCDAQ